MTPLELRFFEYFLQRHLGLRFAQWTFMEFDRINRIQRFYQEFVGTATIFSHDDVENRHTGDMYIADFLNGSEMLTKYPPDYTRFY